MSPVRSRPLTVMLGALVLALSACTPPRPYPTAVPDALKADPTVGAAPGSRILALCYNRWLNPADELLEEARFQCGEGTVTFLEHDLLWTSCGLLQPARASFLCAPSAAAQ